MKICEVCSKRLRRDNNIGHCRQHRNMSANRKNYIKNYAENHKEKVLENKRRYYPKANKRTKQRLKTDPLFKLQSTLRNRLNTALRRRGATKNSGVRNLGCTIWEFKSYLEKLFKPGMSWQNHGEWHIDHIIPLSKFNLSNEEGVKKACHYSNLQPLWAFENMSKGNRI